MLLGDFKRYRPGETCPRSGIYAEIDGFGKPTGRRVTSVQKEPFPPTENTGWGYVLDEPTN
jgi:hypothetical protein